jgi:hypothetical protein
LSSGVLIQVSKKQPDEAVIDARYLRARAEWCLALASQLSDANAAANVRKEAAHYYERAQELEDRSPSAGVEEPRQE